MTMTTTTMNDFSVLFHWIVGYILMFSVTFDDDFETYHHHNDDNGKFNAFFFFFDSFSFFLGTRESIYSLVLCIFFKEIWLKLNYVKIFRQNFCILYTCTHIFCQWRDNINPAHSLTLIFILHLISLNNNNNRKKCDWNTCTVYILALEIYLYIKIEQAQKKQIDWYKSEHVFSW